ncbi:cytochrome c oxidase subunit 4 [Nocardioides marmoraquaticus]
MKAETWMFASCSIFFVLVTPLYYLSSGDITGTTALVMTFLLTTLVAFYLGFHASKMQPRPEDRKDAEIAEGAGELGFFPPYSWWPLWCGLCLGLMTLAVGMHQWWLFIIGAALGVLALSGLVFEYYRGIHAH